MDRIRDLRERERAAYLPCRQTRCWRANAGGKGGRRGGSKHSRAAGAAEPEISMQLDVIAREGARRMLAAALRAEVAECLEASDGERDEEGLPLVF